MVRSLGARAEAYLNGRLSIGCKPARGHGGARPSHGIVLLVKETNLSGRVLGILQKALGIIL